jgi:hypothetical protein
VANDAWVKEIGDNFMKITGASDIRTISYTPA